MRIFFLFFFFSFQLVNASDYVNDRMNQVYTCLFNLQFKKADSLLSIEKNENPNNPFIFSNEYYKDFLSILITDDQQYYDQYKKNKYDRINILKEFPEESPYYFYMLSDFYLQSAFCHLKFQDYALAFYSFGRSFSYLEQNKEKYPEFILNYKGLGLLNMLLSSVPDKHQYLLNIFGMQGDMNLGIDYLNRILDDSTKKTYHNEIIFMMSFIQLHVSNDEDVWYSCLDNIGKSYLDNVLLSYVAASISNKLGLNDYCIEILENYPLEDIDLDFYFLNYLLANSKLYQLNFEEAKHYYKIFVSNYTGKNHIKSAYQKLAWISFLESDDKKMKYYFKQATLKGQKVLDIDEKAHNDAKDYIVSHPLLLEARFLYDGGYYKQALARIDSINPLLFSNTNYQIEYWYRLGRITTKLGYSYKKIIEYYDMSYEKGKDSDMYFAPMACLQIGLIYEKNGQLKEAYNYFIRCLNFSDFEYQNSIHYKAKKGIKRVLPNI